jgi:hypothetical protein
MSIPPQEPSAQARPKEAQGGGFLDKIKKVVEDNYNGLYVIVLKPRMPEGILYGIGILGLIIGMLWAYSFAPTEFSGANPNRLNAGSQQQWLQLVAVSASDRHLYGADQAIALASSIPNPRATITALLASGTLSEQDAEALQALYDMLPADIDATSAPVVGDPGFLAQLFSFILAAAIGSIIMVIVVAIVVLIWRFFIYDNFVSPLLSKIREIRDPAYRIEVEQGKEGIRIAKLQREERDRMRNEVSESDLGAPVMQNLAIYATGRSFDESYEIELESGEFLGQSGANISEDVAPDPVAIDVWLFDIHDSMTLVKTFITPQGNADPNIRSRVLSTLNSPNDLVVATPDASITIESPKLRLQTKFSTLEINENGRFSNFKMVMRAWQKDGAGARIAPPMPAASAPAPMPMGAPPMSNYDNIQFAPPPPPAPPAGAKPMSDYDDISFDPPPVPPAPAGAKPMSDYDDITFDPPPAMPQRPAVQPLQPPPLRPQAPQPLQPPPLRRPEDDDPFGGTGDFTPLNG